MKIPILFRGDSIPKARQGVPYRALKGNTQLQAFVADGIYAKFNDGGRLDDLNRPLEELVLDHIGYPNCNDCRQDKPHPRCAQWRAYHSPLISFSEAQDSALYFLDRSKKKSFRQPSDDESPTHVVMSFGPLHGVKEAQSHVYELLYEASAENVAHLPADPVAAAGRNKLDVMATALAQRIVHQHIAADDTVHCAWLVDAQPFLAELKTRYATDERWKLATERAADAKEWLVFPRDPMLDGSGFSSRLTHNEFLIASALWVEC